MAIYLMYLLCCIKIRYAAYTPNQEARNEEMIQRLIERVNILQQKVEVLQDTEEQLELLQHKVQLKDQEMSQIKADFADLKRGISSNADSRGHSDRFPDVVNISRTLKENCCKFERNPRSSENAVAFYVRLSRDLKQPGTFRTIIFDHVFINEGNAYNTLDGIFTCTEDGIYIFSWSITAGLAASGPMTQLVLNGNTVGQVRSFGVGNVGDPFVYESGTTAVLRLNSGDVVVLRTGRSSGYIISNLDAWSSFSGWKIF